MARGYIYLMFDPRTDTYKIGISTNVETRYKRLRTDAPQLQLLHTVESFKMRDDEYLLHSHFRKKRLTGEWFALDESDLDEFNDYANIIAMQTKVAIGHLQRVTEKQRGNNNGTI